MRSNTQVKLQRYLYRRNCIRRMSDAMSRFDRDEQADRHVVDERARRMGINPDVLAAYERYTRRKAAQS